MNLKTIMAMLGRKNVTLASGFLLGLAAAVQFPELVEQAREWVAAVGAGGILGIVLSLMLSAAKEKSALEREQEALYTAPPGYSIEPIAAPAAPARIDSDDPQHG